VLTIYRLRLCPEDPVTVEGARRWAKEQGVAHPVLVDERDAYRARLRPGPVGYPALFLLGPDGVVLWEGSTGREGYEAECDAALEAALPPPSGERVLR
jgi:hypothetical protein